MSLTRADWPDALQHFLDELRIWGARTNLVGSLALDALERHVADSLAAAAGLPASARVVDLGSGAGFPGIPLAIARPDLDLTLVEIRERRVHFLRHVARKLELGCSIERRKIEEDPEKLFDYALLRAVSEAPRALDLGRRWVRPGGEIWIWSGPSPDLSPDLIGGTIPLESGGAILRVPLRRD